MEILEIFTAATVYLSGSQYLSLHFLLSYFNILLWCLAEIVEEENSNNEENPLLAVACQEGWKVLNKYWKKNDSYLSHVIAMVLDP